MKKSFHHHCVIIRIQITEHYLLGFFLELLDGTLVDTTTFVDQVTSGGGLAGVDMSNDDYINVYFLLTHFTVLGVTSFSSTLVEL